MVELFIFSNWLMARAMDWLKSSRESDDADQSAYRLTDEEKVSQEKKSLRNIPDSFKKIIIEENDIVPYRDDDGFVRMGLFDFLLNPRSLEF